MIKEDRSRVSDKKYYDAHREERLAYQARYRADHKEEKKEYNQKYCEEHKEEKKEYNQKYRLDNKDRLKEYEDGRREQRIPYQKKRNKEYCEKHKPERRAYQQVRRDTDTQFRLSLNLRRALNRAIERNFKKGKTVQRLGCSIEFLRQHLESMFQPGMTWENRSPTSWHIDHIKPMVDFDLTDEEQVLRVCHYTNLQPLWMLDNIRKSRNEF